jgi:hypothetical protein
LTTRVARVLILANSRKLNHRCVAGIDLDTGIWVRPVSGRAGGELLESHCVVGDAPAVPGDVVLMPLGNSKGTVHHPEDVLIAGKWRPSEPRWPVAQIADVLRAKVERDVPLLGSQGDFLTDAEIGQRERHSSLQLFRAESTKFHLEPRGDGHQLRAAVRSGTEWTDLVVTDDAFEAESGRKRLATIPVCLLTLSLAERHATGRHPDRHYKLVAAVMPLDTP